MAINFLTYLKDGLPKEAFKIVEQVKLATDQIGGGSALYLVGGGVRDLLLRYPSSDLDFVVEPNGIELAQIVASKFGGELIEYERFGTATWTPQNRAFQRSIDFVTARKEIYSKPAALPNVTPSGIKDDLFRRDFTINALAIRLDGDHFGQLIDLYNGLEDLNGRLIRILHGESFIDDPTRIWRAVRYEQRLNFKITPETVAAIPDGIAVHHRLSADRIRHELEKVLEESNACAAMLERLDQLGLFHSINPQLRFEPRLVEQFRQLDKRFPQSLSSDQIAERALGRLLLFLYACCPTDGPEGKNGIAESLRLGKETTQSWQWLNTMVNQLMRPELDDNVEPFFVVKQLNKGSRLDLALLDILLQESPEGLAILNRYQTEWRFVEVDLNGHDLQRMGVKPGPHLGQLLKKLYSAKLKKEVNSKEEEIAFIEKQIKSSFH